MPDATQIKRLMRSLCPDLARSILVAELSSPTAR
jgi:hypothetical protein